MKRLFLLSLFVAACMMVNAKPNAFNKAQVKSALKNGALANDALYRSHRYVEAWLKHRDPKTGLIPRNLNGDNYWNAQDAGADNYPFMVLTSFFTDTNLYQGKMQDMLKAEIKYTSRVNGCPSTYDFDKQAFRDTTLDIGNVIFGSAEYVKDGLLPLTEWLGKSPWSGRMVEILNGLHKITGVVTRIEGNYLGGMQEVEANGDLLQTLSRMYWMTGNKDYLNWAIEIGDYYLLRGHDLLKLPKLRMRDHGGEIILGLCELYATVHFAMPEKQQQYKEPLYKVLNRVLKVGRNQYGMFYNEINPVTGAIVDGGIADTWGYIYDGYYTVYLIDGYQPYKDAVKFAMSNLYDHYRSFDWEHGSQDGYADSVESGINFLNRLPTPSVAAWIDSEIQIMLHKQRPDGIVEGWHGDGNYARTAIMYVLWKSQGSYLTNWCRDVSLGAVDAGKSYLFVVKSDTDWNGKICFDKPRHSLNMHMPIDWTRINQFPEWFAPRPEQTYRVSIDGKDCNMKGEDLYRGIDLNLSKGEKKCIVVYKK